MGIPREKIHLYYEYGNKIFLEILCKYLKVLHDENNLTFKYNDVENETVPRKLFSRKGDVCKSYAEFKVNGNCDGIIITEVTKKGRGRDVEQKTKHIFIKNSLVIIIRKNDNLRDFGIVTKKKHVYSASVLCIDEVQSGRFYINLPKKLKKSTAVFTDSDSFKQLNPQNTYIIENETDIKSLRRSVIEFLEYTDAVESMNEDEKRVIIPDDDLREKAEKRGLFRHFGILTEDDVQLFNSIDVIDEKSELYLGDYKDENEGEYNIRISDNPDMINGDRVRVKGKKFGDTEVFDTYKIDKSTAYHNKHGTDATAARACTWQIISGMLAFFNEELVNLYKNELVRNGRCTMDKLPKFDKEERENIVFVMGFIRKRKNSVVSAEAKRVISITKTLFNERGIELRLMYINREIY